MHALTKNGSLLAAISIFCGVAGGVTLKLAGTNSNALAVALRSIIVVCLVFPFAVWNRERFTRALNRKMFLRSCLEAAAILTLALTFFQLPISLIMAALAALPAFSTFGAVKLLGEQTNRTAWIGVAGAFGGCILIIKPAIEVSALGGALLLCAIFFYAARDIYTRKYAANLDAGVSVAVSNTIVAILSLLLVPAAVWQAPDLGNVVMLLLSGLAATGAGVIILRAHQLAPVSKLAPLRFTSILWALAFDWLVWGFVPDPLAWLGIAIISFSVLLIFKAGRSSNFPKGPIG
ncbi:DMT family transporter [Halocynthiibacter sp. C4]|uniref:DMT family transporter n=1 Tax=Halocynthiibacter sp. C4 TaxID=2992758 RepID=UPI00237B34EC|nr:DMT family transporter [Halocynthiibacter sp. C4]MDE0591576.1 DMT family transporter [Halocynthiibacter sp. C4]